MSGGGGDSGDRPGVTVVVPMLDAAATLPALLDALADQQDAPAYDVVLVDNGSTDDSVAIATAHPLRPRVVRETRRGSYAARNAGLAATGAEVLAFTDADCVPDRQWLARGVAATRRAPLVGGSVEVIRSANPTVWERLDAGHYLDQRENVEILGFAATANLLARREVFDLLGGFEAGLRSGGDRELCRRARAAGLGLVYADDALVRHHPRTTLRATWALNRRIGYSLRDLHRIGMHPPWWRDQQMVLSPRWARGTSSDATTRTPAPTAVGVWLTVIGARWAGRVTGR